MTIANIVDNNHGRNQPPPIVPAADAPPAGEADAIPDHAPVVVPGRGGGDDRGGRGGGDGRGGRSGGDGRGGRGGGDGRGSRGGRDGRGGHGGGVVVVVVEQETRIIKMMY